MPILPGDSIYINLIKKKAQQKTNKIFTFGENEKCDSKFINLTDEKISFIISKQRIDLKKRIKFKNWEINISIILIVLKILKVNLKKLSQNLEKLKPLSGRGEIVKIKKGSKNIYLIDESYNSSPSALITAIENLNQKSFNSNENILVIGDMLELGKFSNEFHKKIIQTVIEVQQELLLQLEIFQT